jgi:hypothetical protein
MEKEFVPYDQALALKELGFDEPCFGRYDGKGKNKGKIWYEMPNRGQETIPVGDVLAPLYQQAFRWFRDTYDLKFLIEWDYDHYNAVVLRLLLKKFNTYEEAEQECLKKLIEIVKT